jgi:hypothetical protein
MMKKVCILSFSPINRDVRILRQVEHFSRDFSVTVIGFGELNGPLKTQVKSHSVPFPSGRRRQIQKAAYLIFGKIWPRVAYEGWYWREHHHQKALELILQEHPDIIHANEWPSLPIAARASASTKAAIVLDLHEYAPLEWESRPLWRTLLAPMVDYFLREYGPQVSASVTVGDAIAQRYEHEYGFHPILVMNAAQRTGARDFKATDPGDIRLVHHGLAIRERKLERMIETLAYLDRRYTLHFMLIEAGGSYIEQLGKLAQRLAPGRVFFHPPVAPHNLVERLSEFDMGIYLLSSTDFNHAVALPNKFFDFVAAGLSICIGPSLEMARLTREFGFGVVAPTTTPQGVGKVLNGLEVSDIDRMKRKALEAREVLNAEVEMGKLSTLYTTLLGEV